MKYSALLFAIIPLLCNSQNSSREFFLGYEKRNSLAYNFSGFVMGANYQISKMPLLQNIIPSENYFLSIEIGHSILSEVPKIHTSDGNMQTVKIGYQFITYYNLYYSLRFRINAVLDPSYRYNAIRNDVYKSFTAYGPELMIGKKFYLNKSFLADIGVGLTYNWSYEVVSSRNGWFDPSKPQSYSWLNYWTKGVLKIGYHF